MKLEIDVISLLIGFILASAPYWITASNIRDLSEAKSTAIGAATVVALKILTHNTNGKEKKK